MVRGRGHSRLTLLSFSFIPGHTILQSDTQIYIPILEHIADPSLLQTTSWRCGLMSSFTLYDEAALILRGVTGLSFEQVLPGSNSFIVPCGAGPVSLATGRRACRRGWRWLMAALSLWARIMGPAVLIVEYEPVPRGFALPFVIFSLGWSPAERWMLRRVGND